MWYVELRSHRWDRPLHSAIVLLTSPSARRAHRFGECGGATET
jgi:hypothetical protein